MFDYFCFEGDACDSDKDNDGVTNSNDNCPYVINLHQNHTKLTYDLKSMFLTPMFLLVTYGGLLTFLKNMKFLEICTC